MADEEKIEDDVDGDAEESAKPEKKKKGLTSGGPHVLVRLFLGASGLLLIVGFFLPWMNLASEAHPTVSGLELVTSNDTVIIAMVGAETQRWLLLLIPGFGVALTGLAVAGLRFSGPISALLGLLIVGYGLVTVVIFFFQRTELGLWLVLLGAFVAVATGVIAFVRSRDKKAASSVGKSKAAETDD